MVLGSQSAELNTRKSYARNFNSLNSVTQNFDIQKTCDRITRSKNFVQVNFVQVNFVQVNFDTQNFVSEKIVRQKSYYFVTQNFRLGELESLRNTCVYRLHE